MNVVKQVKFTSVYQKASILNNRRPFTNWELLNIVYKINKYK